MIEITAQEQVFAPAKRHQSYIHDVRVADENRARERIENVVVDLRRRARIIRKQEQQSEIISVRHRSIRLIEIEALPLMPLSGSICVICGELHLN